MKDEEKTKEQLLDELKALRQRVTELETAETERKRVEEALRESGERLLKAQRVARMGFLDWNLKTNDMYWSDEIYNLYGIDPQGETSNIDLTMQLVHPDDLEFVQKNLDMAIKGVKKYDIDHRKLRPDGKVIWVHAQAELVRDADGNPESLLVTVVDITDRKQAEEMLRESEELQRVMLSNISDAIFITDDAGEFTYICPNTGDIFGYSFQETEQFGNIARLLGDCLFDPDTLETLREISNIEWEISDKVGREHTLLVNVKSVSIKRGTILYVCRDITERKRTEDALKKSETKWHLLLQSIPSFIVEMDLEGVVISLNRTQPGFSLEDFVGKSVFEFTSPGGLDKLRSAFSEVIEKRGPVEYEAADYGPYQSQAWYDHQLAPVIEDGEITSILMIVNDITDRKQAEEQIENQNILLKKAVQEKQQEMEALFERLLRQEKLATIGQIAGSISHELRNPLGAVKQSVFILKRLSQRGQLDASDPKLKKHLDLIDAEIDISNRVISDLLQMTRINPPRREQTDLYALSRDVAGRCQLPQRIHFSLELPPEPFLIWADPLQLRQVLLNLLTNAVQAIARDGSITIRAKQLTEDRSTVIEVEDDGIGIAPDDLIKVFEPLYTTKAQGTGLGLSICKQIIEHHHGQISVRSSRGQGTTVRIVLPTQE